LPIKLHEETARAFADDEKLKGALAGVISTSAVPAVSSGDDVAVDDRVHVFEHMPPDLLEKEEPVPAHQYTRGSGRRGPKRKVPDNDKIESATKKAGAKK
jgi:hypothetical protein